MGPPPQEAEQAPKAVQGRKPGQTSPTHSASSRPSSAGPQPPPKQSRSRMRVPGPQSTEHSDQRRQPLQVGQVSWAHSIVCLASPSQPPATASLPAKHVLHCRAPLDTNSSWSALESYRVRLRSPPPQLTLQTSHGPQPPQSGQGPEEHTAVSSVRLPSKSNQLS